MRTALGKPTIYLGFTENGASHTKMEVEEAKQKSYVKKGYLVLIPGKYII